MLSEEITITSIILSLECNACANAESPRVSASGHIGPASAPSPRIFFILLFFTSSVIVLCSSDYRRVLLLGVDIRSCFRVSNPVCPPARPASWLIPDRTAAYLAIAKCRLHPPLNTPPPPISASATTIEITVLQSTPPAPTLTMIPLVPMAPAVRGR